MLLTGRHLISHVDLLLWVSLLLKLTVNIMLWRQFNMVYLNWLLDVLGGHLDVLDRLTGMVLGVVGVVGMVVGVGMIVGIIWMGSLWHKEGKEELVTEYQTGSTLTAW